MGTQDDPARAWAYEHYGFTEEAPAIPASAPLHPTTPPRGAPSRRSRMSVVAGGAVLGVLLVGGVGGAALAAAAGDGGGGPGFGLVDGGGGGGGNGRGGGGGR